MVGMSGLSTAATLSPRGVIFSLYPFNFSFYAAIGPVSWACPAEVFPIRICTKVVSFSAAYSPLFTAMNAVAEFVVRMLDLALFLGLVPWSPDKRRVEN
jgi:hypothetical protein